MSRKCSNQNIGSICWSNADAEYVWYMKFSYFWVSIVCVKLEEIRENVRHHRGRGGNQIPRSWGKSLLPEADLSNRTEHGDTLTQLLAHVYTWMGMNIVWGWHNSFMIFFRLQWVWILEQKKIYNNTNLCLYLQGLLPWIVSFLPLAAVLFDS